MTQVFIKILFIRKVSIEKLITNLEIKQRLLLKKISCITNTHAGQVIIEFVVVLLFCISLIALSTTASKKYKSIFKNNETLKSR